MNAKFKLDNPYKTLSIIFGLAIITLIPFVVIYIVNLSEEDTLPPDKIVAIPKLLYEKDHCYTDVNGNNVETTDIYLISKNGQGRTNLTQGNSRNFRPAWSKTNQKIAFSSNRDGDLELYVMLLNGTNIDQLTNNSFNDTQPDWSKDGNSILFVSNRDGNNEIYKMDYQTKIAENLTNSPNTDDVEPDFSPDGKTIVFERDKSIWIMNYDGSSQEKIIERGFDPDFSPDGSKLIYVGFGQNPPYVGHQLLFEVNCDGSNPKLFSGYTIKGMQPKYSSDGKNVVFQYRGYNCPQAWYFLSDIYVLETFGSITNVTVHPYDGNLYYAAPAKGNPEWIN